MPTVRATAEAIARAAEVLRSGGLVAFPTETVYGLGADARSAEACARIFEAKRRPHFDPLIVHVTDAESAASVADVSDPRVRELAARFWPGPLTLVLPKTDLVPDIVTSGLPTVAVRVPAHPVAQALLAASALPIAAPSANPFGYISPTTAEHVERQLGDRVSLILDGGECTVGVESTIVDLSGERPALLRPGGLPEERLRDVLGELERPERSTAPRAPGQLESHYAPRTRLVLVGEGGARVGDGERAGLLAVREPDPELRARCAAVEVLSPSGDLVVAAARLFAALHRLDGADLDVIYAERVPERGIGVAIMDRLERASTSRDAGE